MASRTPDAVRRQAHELAKSGESKRAIARRLEIGRSTVSRILSEAEPFSGGEGGTPNPPPNNYGADQPPPPPEPLNFRGGYHDHTFKSTGTVLGFEGWDLERVRNAIALHDQGFFLESSLLAIVATRFGPVFAALSQAVAPALSQPRHVKGGDRGLARILRDEVERQLAPRAGLMPSAHFPPTLWGSCSIDLRLMGFAVLQHVYGAPDPDTGVRPVYTRRWPTWAVRYDRYRRTYVALTTEGPVDIISGDGKFTLLADTEEPHFDGAIRALALEVIDGSLAKLARQSYIDRYGNPKWIAFMPENTNVRSPEGDAMFDAIETLQGPDGFGVLPGGADYKVAQMTAGQNSVFTAALDNVWRFVAAILLGSDGTMSPSTGVYSAPIFAGVRRDLVERMLKALVRGVNMGHVAPFLSLNYAASIAEAKGWVEPVLDIPLPNPDAEARIKAYAERVEKLHAIIKAEREAGFVVTQERVDQLAGELDVQPPTLDKNGAIPLDVAKRFVRVREGRASMQLAPLGDERDDMLEAELEEEAAAEAETEVAEAEAQAEAEKEITVAEETGDSDEEQP